MTRFRRLLCTIDVKKCNFVYTSAFPADTYMRLMQWALESDKTAEYYRRRSTLLSFLAVLAFVCVFCPRTGRPIACLLPTWLPIMR